MASTCRRATLALQVRTIYLEPMIRKDRKRLPDWFRQNVKTNCTYISRLFQASAWPRSCRAAQGVSSLPAQRRAFSSRGAASTAAWATCPPSTQRHRATLEQGTLHHTYSVTRQSKSFHSHLVTFLYFPFPVFIQDVGRIARLQSFRTYSDLLSCQMDEKPARWNGHLKVWMSVDYTTM